MQRTHSRRGRHAIRSVARGSAVAVVAALALLAHGGRAEAATVSLQDCGFGCSRLAFSAAIGEANSTSITEGGFGQPYSIVDDNAPVTAGNGCTAVDIHTARCGGLFVNIAQAVVSLGDGNDTLRWAANTGVATVNGGDGNDSLVGYYGWQGGEVTFWGGPGEDVMRDGQRRDVFQGGDGVDTISYSTRGNPVTVDLSAGTGGEAGESDQLSAVESAVGTPLDDELKGAGDGDKLDGGPGNDIVEGRWGVDELIGGSGDDRIWSRDATDDTVRCGDGFDYVLADTADLVPDCEDVGAPLPWVEVGNATVVEGTGGTPATVQFPVTLSERSGRPVSLTLPMSGGTATAGTDFDGTTQYVYFAPRATTAVVFVPVVGDAVDEPDETFVVTPTALVNALFASPASATGTIVDDDEAPAVPTATTGAATGIRAGRAKLNGTVAPSGQATSWSFQYGTTTAYGKATAVTPLSILTGTQAVAAGIRRLQPSTTYHYRLVATSAAGTSYGVDRTFTTKAA